mmetsp:Transcript_33349/g.51118  ORF Transcript_33349/g.51118 Transcript_33349/m.51118 type:complete len:175 (+) Transcript_33349:913-1437(+)|eukprot:CAMPEP_0170493500 /NCGR_PEP_ID=MMETSP0208-20121228/14002_1 /TAXON_ID=197538 /ORGANISM="Strombidium inclinatum, Strain S3" /LENGTH=174 /DNA_ID=CAMNT_0010769435 /DNA_START=914 /DNA_END=1438 /DNA_ORIENTATION=-
MDYLAPVYKQKYDVDLEEILSNLKGAHEFDEKLNWKLMNEKSYDDYHENYSSGKYIHQIKKPTLFYYCEDDPIINLDCIDLSKAQENDKVLITHTKHGAHLCTHKSFFSKEQFIIEPAFHFFDYFKRTEMKKPNPFLRKSKDSEDETECRQGVVLLESEADAQSSHTAAFKAGK